MRYEMRFSGVGGQGNMLAAMIVSEAAIYFGNKHACYVPTYTSQVRGGPTKADIIISDAPILYSEANNIDYFMSLHPKTYEMYKSDSKQGSIIVVDMNMVQVPEEDKKNFRVYELPIVETARNKVGNVITANIVSLGITAKLIDAVSEEGLLKAVERRVPPKFLDLNRKAFEIGMSLVK